MASLNQFHTESFDFHNCSSLSGFNFLRPPVTSSQCSAEVRGRVQIRRSKSDFDKKDDKDPKDKDAFVKERSRADLDEKKDGFEKKKSSERL